MALLAAGLPSCSSLSSQVPECDRTVTVSLNPGGGDSIAICWSGPAARQRHFAGTVADGFGLPREWVNADDAGGLVIQLHDRLGHFEGNRYRFDFDTERLRRSLAEAGYGDFVLVFCPISRIDFKLDADPKPLDAWDPCKGWRVSQQDRVRFSYIVEPSVKPYRTFLAVVTLVAFAFTTGVVLVAGGRRSSWQRHRRGAVALWAAAPLMVLGGWSGSTSATAHLTLRYRLSPLADGLGGLPAPALAGVMMTLIGFVLWKPKPPALPPPAWYPDPGGSATLRYWDGCSWTPVTTAIPALGQEEEGRNFPS